MLPNLQLLRAAKAEEVKRELGRTGALNWPPVAYAGNRTSRVVSVSVHLDGVIMRISANP
jgi:hypothetical protein